MTTQEKMVAGHLPPSTAQAILGDVDASVTATGSTSQSGSYGIKASLTQVTTCSSGNGVRLPAANPGDEFVIANWSTGQTCLLYPPSGGKINGGSSDASVNIATAKTARAKCIDNLNYAVVVGA